MTTIALGSAKGGTGKTISALSFAECLCHLGRRVLLIDADAATNGLTLFLSTSILERTVRGKALGLFESAGAVPDVFHLAERKSVIPAAYREHPTVGTDIDTVRASLESALSFAKAKYDYVLIDCQAGADLYAQTAIELSDDVLVFSEYDFVSVQGVRRLQGLRPDLFGQQNIWLVFCKVLPEFADRVGDALELVKFLPPIPWNEEVVHAMVRGRVPVDMDKGNIHTAAVLRTLGALLSDDLEEDIGTWRAGARSRFVTPMDDQLESQRSIVADLQREYDSEREGYERLNQLDKRGRMIGAIIGGTLILVGTVFLANGLIGTGSASIMLLVALVSFASSSLIGILQKRVARQRELPERRSRMDSLRLGIDETTERLSRLQSLRDLEVRKLDEI